MAEEKSAEILEEKKDSKKKSVLGKVKSALLPDQEEQAAIISTMVRIGVLVWSGGILTLNYVTLPGLAQQKIDPTFIASVFTGVLASFGIATASKKGDGTMKMNGENGQISKKDMEKLIERAASSGPVQTIRIEQAPLIVKAHEPPVKPTI
jgi:CTP:molybdopterin cytidylyltransferase MocA